MRSLLPFVLLLIGEGVFIWMEMLIAHTIKSPKLDDSLAITKMAVAATLAGLVIIAGYYFGYKSSKNIWLVTAVSIGSILITEPIISWIVFHERPTFGASVGLTFGVLGILSTIIL